MGVPPNYLNTIIYYFKNIQYINKVMHSYLHEIFLGRHKYIISLLRCQGLAGTVGFITRGDKGGHTS